MYISAVFWGRGVLRQGGGQMMWYASSPPPKKNIIIIDQKISFSVQISLEQILFLSLSTKKLFCIDVDEPDIWAKNPAGYRILEKAGSWFISCPMLWPWVMDIVQREKKIKRGWTKSNYLLLVKKIPDVITGVVLPSVADPDPTLDKEIRILNQPTIKTENWILPPARKVGFVSEPNGHPLDQNSWYSSSFYFI